MKAERNGTNITKEKNFWKIPLDGVKIFNGKTDTKIGKKITKLLKDNDEMELYQEWKNKNFNVSINERKISDMPNDFKELCESNEIVRTTFEKLPEHHKRQYILWIESSLNEDIRKERIERLVRIFSQRYNNF